MTMLASIFIYIIIGLFIATLLKYYADKEFLDTTGIFVICLMFWPAILVILAVYIFANFTS